MMYVLRLFQGVSYCFLGVAAQWRAVQGDAAGRDYREPLPARSERRSG